MNKYFDFRIEKHAGLVHALDFAGIEYSKDGTVYACKTDGITGTARCDVFTRLALDENIELEIMNDKCYKFVSENYTFYWYHA